MVQVDRRCNQRRPLRERRRGSDTDRREGNVIIGAEIGVMWLPAKECWQPPEARGNAEHPLPWSLQKEHRPANPLTLGQNGISDTDFGLLAFRTEKNFCCPCHQVYGDLLQKPWGGNTDRYMCPLMRLAIRFQQALDGRTNKREEQTAPITIFSRFSEYELLNTHTPPSWIGIITVLI